MIHRLDTTPWLPVCGNGDEGSEARFGYDEHLLFSAGVRILFVPFSSSSKREMVLLHIKFRLSHTSLALPNHGSPHSTTRTLPNSAFSKTFNMFI